MQQDRDRSHLTSTARRRRAVRWVLAALVLAGLVGGCGSGAPSGPTAPNVTPPSAAPPNTTARNSTSPGPSLPAPRPTQPRRSETPSVATSPPPSARAVADRTLTGIAHHLPGGAISVAALNTSTGATYRFGATGGMWTGSVYKLLVLEALLLQRQHSGTWLTDAELADIQAMIERSDNKAGYRMYLDVGGRDALISAARRLGLRHTHMGVADPALTTSDAVDGIRLLHNLVAHGPLEPRSASFVLGLMRNVQADQRWGVGVVADPRTATANKNGWMQVDDGNGSGEGDHGRWLVNSLGVVQVGGRRLLMAVFTQHNPDFRSGVDLAQKVARTITPVVASGS